MAQEQGKADSIFEFLYADRGRLSSLLAQLSDDGVITTAKRTASQTSSNSGEVGGSLYAVKGSAAVADAATEALERQFDASWLLPLNALTVLQEAGMIRDSLDSGIGSIALVSGSLEFHDVELVKAMWDSISEALAGGLGGLGGHKTKAQNELKQLRMAGKIIKQLPSSLTVTMRSNGTNIWTILDESSVTFQSHLISLKHGSRMQGEWYMLGIVDALPDGPSASAELGDSMMSHLSVAIEGIREMAGRPYGSFGMTPLAIFRPL